MKTLNGIKFINIIFVFSIMIACVPQEGIAQHFGHGGGGGGGARGGGGGMRGGGGGGARPVQVMPGGNRGFNGGGRNIGNHNFQSGPAFRGGDGGRGNIGVRGGVGFRNDNVYHHGGYGYGYHAYAYHPYHPYLWGPYWHPFGFFAATLSANAFLFSVANQQYYYDDGVYYSPSGSGYNVVAPPIGAVVTYLPSGYLTIPVGDDGTYYYYAGAFYVAQGGSFRVVPAPVGAVVTEIPEGATQQNIGDQSYLLYNNTYYQPISQNGQDAYEVVQVN